MKRPSRKSNADLFEQLLQGLEWEDVSGKKRAGEITKAKKDASKSSKGDQASPPDKPAEKIGGYVAKKKRK